MRDSFLGPLTIIIFIAKNSVEVRFTEEFPRKNLVFPFGLVKCYHQTREDKFPSINKAHTPQDIVKVENSPGPVKKTINSKEIRLNGKHHRQYLVRFKNQTADKDKFVSEDSMPDGDLYLRG
ncbi:hypothetical protein O181_112009 [Austropuccinia psidii MF-1]|uniref:Uncharacterized protein n=1 Tax=Austropuccinia psidii MF-1 TaxID=1389203 RepID=A0A9Q3K139_9BASI|nr:hypothetical protein [Austropuccinia psidii MF-1]